MAFTPAADNGCPLCAKYRDPETGEVRFNAETEAGMKEVDDMEKKQEDANSAPLLLPLIKTSPILLRPAGMTAGACCKAC